MVDIDPLIDWIRFYTERLPTQPKPAGDHKYNACCPFHNERNPSFWFNTQNGLWKCESGCGSGNATSFLSRLENKSGEEAWAELCRIAGVDPKQKEEAPRPKLPVTLADYAAQKRLPLAELQKLGLADRPGDERTPAYVAIPYYDVNGRCVAIKRRFNSRNTQRFGWDKGGRVILYGAWLELNKNAKAILLCEGESDAQSCWMHGLPCYGIPGATNFQAEWVQAYLGDRDVYLHVEPDAGGQKFREKTMEKLREAGFKGKVRSFSCHDIDPECKDPSDLHVKYGDAFREKIDPAIKAATLEDLAAPVIRQAKETEPPKKEIQKLNVYRAADLYGKRIEKPPTIVQGMIPTGLTLLAGAPKRGKSWLSLMLAINVAGGEPFLGYPTTQGDVLYLDLESKQYRVQDRLQKLLVGRAPESLYITHESDRLESGLVEQLAMWCDEMEHPTLIIIDTLGRVKGAARRGENAYEGDTRILGELQRFALQRSLAIVCVHHLRKSVGEGDYFERISGSMGITGACDSVMVLQGKRGEANSTLAISSRDFESTELIIGFDSGRWSLRSANSEEWKEEQAYINSPYVRAVIALAHRYKMWRGTSGELAEELLNFGANSADVEPRRVTADLLALREKLNDREGVLIVPPRKQGKGKRIMEVREVRKDGF